jgi:tryptophan-rich sensory protein
MKLFVQIDTTAGRLMLPYLVWSSFALYLNFGVAVLN